MAHVQRTGGIGGYELDEHPPAAAVFAAPETLALVQDAPDHLELGIADDEYVDEPGPGDLDLLDQRAVRQGLDDRLRQVPRRHAGGSGQSQGDIGGQVAVVLLAGLLEAHVHRAFGGQHAPLAQLRERVSKQSLQRFFQWWRAMRKSGAILTG